jgi:hypothetical protein
MHSSASAKQTPRRTNIRRGLCGQARLPPLLNAILRNARSIRSQTGRQSARATNRKPVSCAARGTSEARHGIAGGYVAGIYSTIWPNGSAARFRTLRFDCGFKLRREPRQRFAGGEGFSDVAQLRSGNVAGARDVAEDIGPRSGYPRPAADPVGILHRRFAEEKRESPVKYSVNALNSPSVCSRGIIGSCGARTFHAERGRLA